jgi:hypothetical protein
MAQTLCTATGYALMMGRAILFIALLPGWFDSLVMDERLQLIAVSLSFVALLYSNSVVQSAELKLMNGQDFADAWQKFRDRIGRGTGRWHRDLLLLNLLSGFFGAGVAINLQIAGSLARREARLTATIAALTVWSGVVLLYRGTERFRLSPPKQS